MSAKIKLKLSITCFITLVPLLAISEGISESLVNISEYELCAKNGSPTTLAQLTLARQLGWISDPAYPCGGYYLEPPLTFTSENHVDHKIEVTGGEGLISQRGTSVLKHNVVITRQGEQITANRVYLYRDPNTLKLTTIDMIGDVHVREANTLIVAKHGHYNLETKAKSLIDISYRTSMAKQPPLPKDSPELKKARIITSLTGWGQASEVAQNQPKVYEFYKASFSTCPPINPAWQVKASKIILNKISGRGYVTHARIYVKDIPVFYLPYFNFSIDKTRKTGFLWPTFGHSNKWGSYIISPFYWNMAPNYDMTISPGVLSKRGVQLADLFRYLTTKNEGKINISVLPNDREFANFQQAVKNNPNKYISPGQTAELSEAAINRLENSSTTRKGFFWRDDARFNDHWSSHIDINYAGDDYFLQDFGNTYSQRTTNPLLQEGDLYFKSEHWNFTGRVQSYQTLHPVNEVPIFNQYRRAPQFVLDGDYPNQAFGLEYFIYSEATHFEMLKTPGTSVELPIGNRLHAQPGISLPLYWPYFYISPRLQMALTSYNLSQTGDTDTPNTIRRSLPIFDVASGLSLTRETGFFGHAFYQTFEPQLYYTYIPFRNQIDIPLFDTTLNTLTYDQLFNYNRFTSIDRIGDANQLSVGITSRFIDQESGLEKIRLGIGDIVYFANRRVTLCTKGAVCPDEPANSWRLSPISALLNYNVNTQWGLNANAIWNPISKQLDNSTVGIHYQPDDLRILNLSYSYVHNGNFFATPGVVTRNSENNLQLTDFSFSWPIFHNVTTVGRWTEDWHTNHFQNLLFGLQYDTCCWAARLVGGRSFTNMLAKNNSPQYTSEAYIQFALKGLGNIGSGNPGSLLSTVAGYRTPFG